MNPSNAAGDFKKVPAGYKVGNINKYSPQGNQIYNNAAGLIGKDSYLNKIAGGDQSAFEEMEAPAMRQFNQLQGQNASRFSGFGMGARKGSGFQNFQNQATSDFAQDLQSKRMDYRMNAIKDLMGFSNQLLGNDPYEQFLIQNEPKKNWWQKLIGGAAPIAGAAGGFFAGGLPGAYAGLKGGNAFADAFQ